MASLEGVVTPQTLRHIGLPSQGPSSPPLRVQPSPHPRSSSPPVVVGYHHHMQPPTVVAAAANNNMSIKLEKAIFGRVGSGVVGGGGGGGGEGGGGGGGGGSGGNLSGGAVSPPPVSSNPENNACRLIDYRGTKVAAFSVDGRELICLPQAFELFLKHLVGGLHTVYTKLKRLDVVPVVCNVEQVRVLRGLGAIQPGVNRCKLISPKEFDILYEDCTNSSARPGRPPKRSALAMTPEGLDKLKKNRLQMGNEFYTPGTVNLIGDAKKSLGFGAGYMPFPDLQKSPLLSSGFHYPPAPLAHLAFMPLGHPSMMNLAMATHLSNMRDHLVASGHDRTAHAQEMTLLRGRGIVGMIGGGGGGGGGSSGMGDDRLTDLRSSAEERNNNCSNSSSVIGNLTTCGGNNSKTAAAAAAAAASAAAAMMMRVPPVLHQQQQHQQQQQPPSQTTDLSSLDRPLNLEVQKKSSCDTVACRPPSIGTDHDSSAGSSAASDRHQSISGQFSLLSKRSPSSAFGNGIGHFSNGGGGGGGGDRQNFRQYGPSSSVRHYGDVTGGDRHCGNEERRYENDRMDSDDDSADERSYDDPDDSDSFKRFPSTGGRLLNGDVLDKMATGHTPPPSGYFIANGAEMSSLETLFVNIQGLVKLASERACQKEQQIAFERADMKMKNAKEREVRELLEKQLMEERRKKVFLQRKLKKERRARRSLQDRLLSLDRGKGRCYPPLPVAAVQAPPPPPTVHTPRSVDYSGGSGGEGAGCRDDKHHGVRLIQGGEDGRRLRNASVSADDGNDSERGGGSCGGSAIEVRHDERPNDIPNLMEGFISAGQHLSCGVPSGQGVSSSNNGYGAKMPQLKISDSP